jgi:hypothetical protein
MKEKLTEFLKSLIHTYICMYYSLVNVQAYYNNMILSTSPYFIRSFLFFLEQKKSCMLLSVRGL